MLVDSLALVWLKQGWIHHAGPCQEYQIFRFLDYARNDIGVMQLNRDLRSFGVLSR